MQKKIFSFILIMFFLVAVISFGAENKPVTKANYKLPARFTPNKMKKMVFSTYVDAHWLKHSDRFWYIYETSEGKSFNIVDPAKKTKRPIFDNVRMAAELTKMTKDPYEAKHLPMETIKFIKNRKAERGTRKEKRKKGESRKGRKRRKGEKREGQRGRGKECCRKSEGRSPKVPSFRI